jgi:hypothetical protein
MAKKKTKKKVKKSSKKKAPKKKRTQPIRFVPRIKPPLYHLHLKKEQIMRNVPVMPCTAIQKTRSGFVYAHTQAVEVYNTYREQCELYGLTIKRISGGFREGMSPELVRDESGWQLIKRPCVFYSGKWRITDTDTGEHEDFVGSGAGDNNIWSVMSAQTNAKKQALLDYFETCWPQPTSICELTNEYLQKLESSEDFKKAVKKLLPGNMGSSSAVVAEIEKYFQEQFSKKNK